MFNIYAAMSGGKTVKKKGNSPLKNNSPINGIFISHEPLRTYLDVKAPLFCINEVI